MLDNLDNYFIEKDGIFEVPKEFQPVINTEYPPNNKIIFEQWFYENYDRLLNPKERIYLPIFWTGYWVNHNYGNDVQSISNMQRFIDWLPRNKKYYTIVQYDDVCIIDFSDLDIIVFGMSKRGPEQRIDYVLPLIGQPHPYDFTYDSKREIFANFIGSRSHPIRDEILKINPANGYYISGSQHNIRDYCKILSQSIFTLCPRGYGMPSFRVCEALQYGSIPVYITDYILEPHGIDFTYYGIIIPFKHLHEMDKLLHSVNDDLIKTLQKNGKDIYRKCYTYEANKYLILKHLSNG